MRADVCSPRRGFRFALISLAAATLALAIGNAPALAQEPPLAPDATIFPRRRQSPGQSGFRLTTDLSVRMIVNEI